MELIYGEHTLDVDTGEAMYVACLYDMEEIFYRHDLAGFTQQQKSAIAKIMATLALRIDECGGIHEFLYSYYGEIKDWFKDQI